jgi:hypothetical protein
MMFRRYLRGQIVEMTDARKQRGAGAETKGSPGRHRGEPRQKQRGRD